MRALRRTVLSVVAVVLGSTLLAPGAAEAGTQASAKPSPPDSSCFWTGPFTPDQERFNFAYLDTKALYWSTHYTLPEGARLTLDGRYAHARYQSLNSYSATTAVPLTALNDQQIAPDRGSRNPFLTGADRTFPKRDWTVGVSPKTPPSDPAQAAQNTLYAGQPGTTAQSLIYRVYVPDRGRDGTGGVGLPEPVLTLADGAKLRGRALCDAVSPDHDSLGPRVRPIEEYRVDYEQPGKPAGFPAEKRVEWHSSYTPEWIRQCEYYDRCAPAPPRGVGQYSNLDNSYVSARLNRKLGPVVVLRGRMPSTPATYDGGHRMTAGQLRYWSMCTYEAWSTKVDGPQSCAYDEQIHPDRRGRFTVVVSRPEDRPRNARAACGVKWLAWPERGDGAGHLDDAFVMMRNMLPADGFTQTPAQTRTGDDEAAVMGPYLPRGVHMSTQRAEGMGCG
ncbi:hypothetical protein [Streptomyces boninensis]|uniref:hypothetical protein n=1 Tax=Streptomyces boninensis TaxID=2039455 RepID=UPI003B20DBB8